MTSFNLLSRVRRPDDGPLPDRCLPAPSFVTLPPAAHRGVAIGRTISDTLGIGFFDVYARALTLFEEAAEVVETRVFEALFLNVSPSTVFGLFLPEMAFEISGTNDDNKFFPNSLATGVTHSFTRGIATRPIRMANALNPPDPYWRAGPQKETALGVRIVFWPIWLAKWASINLARFLICVSLFPTTTVKEILFCDWLVTHCERTIAVAVSWMDGWKPPTRSTPASSNFNLRQWGKWQSLERSTLELRRMTTATTKKAKKIVGCCFGIHFGCPNCEVKFVLPRLKKGMRPRASFRRAMVNEWI